MDGEMLFELTEEDLTYALGVEHKLHRKKILLFRDKLTKSSMVEKGTKSISSMEENPQLLSDTVGETLLPVASAAAALKPDIRAVFSHVRHRRMAALEKSLEKEKGLDINMKDEQGNTLLMVAVQNRNTSMVDLMLRRGSRINDVNNNGNTALHFALAYDTTGQLAEFLIENGADDTIENNLGLTPYDGLGEEENKSLIKVVGEEVLEDTAAATELTMGSLIE